LFDGGCPTGRWDNEKSEMETKSRKKFAAPQSSRDAELPSLWELMWGLTRHGWGAGRQIGAEWLLWGRNDEPFPSLFRAKTAKTRAKQGKRFQIPQQFHRIA